VRILATTCLTVLLLTSLSCGSGGSSSSAASGSLSGNWQLNLQQNYPTPPTPLSASGFVVESNNVLTGSVNGPTIISPNGKHDCGGVGPLTGTMSGQNVTFSLSSGGSVFNFTGVISGTSMSGTYQGPGGACYTEPTSGTWTAFLVPPLSGNFSGTLSDSEYMSLLTGVSPPLPIATSGALTQSGNFGASNATLTGTITAQGYPCFQTVSVSGTISGQTVALSIFGYEGLQVGVMTGSYDPTGLSLTGEMILGKTSATETVGPCPPLNGGSGTKIGDSSQVAFTFQ
jgi:hypothetical protein